ncbi:MAG TPA: NTP transferase domain-containing protein [Syntrophorhabdaceae bacterium]|nr:NTP transferase domain-containing protein [Syntrophorhabdaceae bacterium]
MEILDIVVLAAGKGERMISEKPKVMHEIMGKPLIDYVVNSALELHPNRVVVVTGHRREVIEEHLKRYPDVVCAAQVEQKGTAHALLSAEPFLSDGDVLVLYGDVPLITAETLSSFLSFYEQNRSVVFMTTDVENPTGYGRVIGKGELIFEIREQLDASPEEQLIKEINTGICIIPRECRRYLREIGNSNRKGEYYLTDICAIVRSKGEVVRKYNHRDASEVLGVNSRKELLDSNIAMKNRILEKHLKNGISFIDYSVYIDSDVEIGRDVVIYPNSHISGSTVIGARVTIGPGSIIKNSRIHDGVSIKALSVIEDSEILDNVEMKPFSHIQPGITVTGTA